MIVWKCQPVVRDPETGDILARAVETDPETGKQTPAYKYALPDLARQWIYNLAGCGKRTEIIDGKPVVVKDAIDVVDKNHKAPDDIRGHRFKGGFRFTRKDAGGPVKPDPKPEAVASTKG